ncbi:hypothetical protein GCM10009731_51430 [Streptomyces globosus]
MSVCTVTSTRSQLSAMTNKRAFPGGGPLEGGPGSALVGWVAADDPVRESPPPSSTEAPKEQILPGISQAYVPHGRGHSGKQERVPGACRFPLLTDGESRIPAEHSAGAR